MTERERERDDKVLNRIRYPRLKSCDSVPSALPRSSMPPSVHLPGIQVVHLDVTFLQNAGPEKLRRQFLVVVFPQLMKLWHSLGSDSIAGLAI